MALFSGPGNGAGLLTPITVILDEPADPATVTPENVKVTYRQLAVTSPYFYGPFDDDFDDQTWPGSVNEPVLGDVSYDAMTSKVIFKPKAPLLPGQTYAVSLAGVKDIAGNAYAGMPIKFQTIVNAESHRYYFDSLGRPSYYFDYMPDTTTGFQTRRAERDYPGTDGVWHTSDDPITSVYDLNFAADGRIIDERARDPGPDGMFDTADDVPAASIFYKYDSSNRLIERGLFYGPGPDMMYGTPDDQVFNITTASYNGELVANYTTFYEAGTDTQWRTSDDHCHYQQEPMYEGERKQRDVVKDCGPDTLPGAADDRILKYREYTYDANGQLTVFAYRTDIGPDGIWFTTDDGGGSQTKYDRDANGLITQTSQMTLGPDAKWNTADDDITYYDKPTYDANGLMTEDTFYYARGPDGMWGTADDAVDYYVINTYDARGARIESKTFNLGTDGMAKTPDDRVTTHSLFNTAR